MPTELEELVEFLHHGNTEIRKVAIENLLGFSKAQPSIFKAPNFRPIDDLKLLVKDYNPIAKHALTILINLSEDHQVREVLTNDDPFLETLLMKVTSANEPNVNDISMLLANMAKDDRLLRLLDKKRIVPKQLSTSPYIIDQLMDCFVKGAEGAYNKKGDYNYLSYLFADLSKSKDCSRYLTNPQKRDNDSIPLTKLTVFTEHKSHIRRQGVASTIKNVCFDTDAHPRILSATDTNVLPYILLPLAGPEEFPGDETEGMLEDLQLLPPDKERDSDVEILKTHLETLSLLTTTREGRDLMRKVKVYPIVRECHLHVEDESVREACHRVVQIIMRDEEGEGKDAPKIEELGEVDEDDMLVDVA